MSRGRAIGRRYAETGRLGGGRPGRGRRATARGPFVLAAAAAAIVLAFAACASPAPTDSPSETQIVVGPSAWPSGTTGQYGLHIDPSLLGLLPRTIDAYPLVENTDSELAALDVADLANTYDRYAAASIGLIGEDNWLQLVIGHLKDPGSSDIYSAWVSEYASGACSQADGVSGTSQTTINGFVVDVSTCSGGPIVYTLIIGNGDIVSMYDLGPKDLGRQLIQSLY